jgi:hypothetical protein
MEVHFLFIQRMVLVVCFSTALLSETTVAQIPAPCPTQVPTECCPHTKKVIDKNWRARFRASSLKDSDIPVSDPTPIPDPTPTPTTEIPRLIPMPGIMKVR